MSQLRELVRDASSGEAVVQIDGHEAKGPTDVHADTGGMPGLNHADRALQREVVSGVAGIDGLPGSVRPSERNFPKSGPLRNRPQVI